MSLNLIYVAKVNFPAVARFDRPLDGGLTIKGNGRILGNSTTWLGIVVAVVVGIIIQLVILKGADQAWLLGLISGLTVYFGHAWGSFIKRRAGLADGQFMPFVDHGDYVILSGLVFGLMHQFSWTAIGVGIVITYIVHPIVTYLSYLLKWHKHPL